MMEDYSQFSNFFYPKSIAVIGVSADQHNFGRFIVENLLAYGYKGDILAVGRKRGEVLGRPDLPVAGGD